MKAYKTYLFSYQYDSATWTIEIKAESPEDAKARISRLAYAKYDGELIARLPVQLGWLARLSVFFRNLIKS